MPNVPYPYHLSSAEQCRRMDERTISEFGIDGFTLMEIAGTKAADFIHSKIENESSGIFFCGKGNNAGDALVIARILSEKNHQVTVCFIEGTDSLNKDTSRNLELLKRLSGSISFIEWDSNLDVSDFDFIVDGMLGTGLNSELRSPYTEVVQLINHSKLPIFSLDVPTGLHPDTGRVMGSAVKSSYTLTFGASKAGFYLNKGRAHSGEVILYELPFPNHYKEQAAYLIDESWVYDSEMEKSDRVHKYDGGVVYIIAGSEGITGAAILAAQSAWATGVGAVVLITPKGNLEIYEQNLVQIIKKPVGELADTFFKESHLKEIQHILSEKSGKLLIGPGLGRYSETISFIQKLLSELEMDCVIDADALFALSEVEDFKKPANANWILTPHIGELKTLLNSNISDDFDRLIQTSSKAKQKGITILSKGYPGILSSKKGNVYLTNYNTSVFSRAGFGDILAGKVVGFWLQKRNEELACCFALLNGKEKAEKHIFNSDIPLEPLHII